MKLRPLEIKDASKMLEWMHDEKVAQNFHVNFKNKTLSDCIAFIENSKIDKENLHFAVVDDADTYMGTVSLKHIDRENKSAEFAIVMRVCAMGAGFAKYGMSELLRIGIEEKYLKKIYWSVLKENKRAIHFYNKNGYQQVFEVPEEAYKWYAIEDLSTFFWYEIK